jgi:hypothetical protein
MARPQIEIDAAQVEKLAQIGCKNTEIADYFLCSEDTITRRFAEELTKGRADLRMSLRRMQIKSAQAGNVVMLIWLGKQMLGQQDRTIVELSKIPDSEFLQEAERRLNDGSSKPADSPKTPER